ncbi:hypothetical protein HXY33_07525 [Candidatus Bathyarchaeota archaeon]|nr:hypothetical protein [Candidatus Bathyarchaeota archaeon]
MRIQIDKKAVSTFVLIILMLSSAVFGATIAYLGVITSYYNMPENTSFLIVENVAFQSPPDSSVLDATYFNVTILNPSNSALDINITSILLTVEGKNQSYTIVDTEPQLSLIQRGTRQTFRCEQNWSDLAGETVRIEPVAEEASIKSQTYLVPKVKLELTPNFNPSKSIEHFNLTIQNPSDSISNLTVSEIFVFAVSMNTTQELPYFLPISESETFQCNYNWNSLRGINATLTVKTSEGYEVSYTTDELAGAFLSIDEIKFDYTNAMYFNVTITRTGEFTGSLKVDEINVTLPDESVATSNVTISLPFNRTISYQHYWDWNAQRNKTITVKIHTEPGFTAEKTVVTPLEVVWNITDVEFDLDDVQHFLLNLTNTAVSLQNVTLTGVRIVNGTRTIIVNQTTPNLPYILKIGENTLVNCTLDWKTLDLRGKTITIIIITQEGLNLSRTFTVPSVKIQILGDDFMYGDLRDQYPNITIPIPVPYFNLTVSNSDNSLTNVTITRITIKTMNATYEIDYNLTNPVLGSSGYILRTGEIVTIMCSWDWTRYLNSDPVEVTVYTAEGFQTSKTWTLSP